jgi:FkbM family methyltransferase
MLDRIAHEPEPGVRRIGTWLRRLPDVRGKHRVARRLLRNSLDAQDVLLNDCEGNSFLLPHLAEPMAFELLTCGVYEAQTRAAILERMETDSVFVDVGANIGLFTVPAARKARAGRVIAVEASPLIVSYLQENVRRNRLSNVHIHALAAWDRSGESVRFYPAPPDKFGMGSLGPQFGASEQVVETIALDNLVGMADSARVRVLKIDVEGFEARVLDGARQLLTRTNAPLVLLEFWEWAEDRANVGGVGTAQQLLRELGYRIWRLEDWRKKKPPLAHPLTRGGAMLVAERP